MSRGELLTTPGSSSTCSRVYSTNSSDATTQCAVFVQVEGFGVSAALKWYSAVDGVHAQIAQLAFGNTTTGPVFNISQAGAAGTGNFTTGNRTSVGFGDSFATGKGVLDAFFALKGYDTPQSTYKATEANMLDSSWLLLRGNATAHTIEASLTTSGGVRQWTTLAGTGTTTVPGGNAGTGVSGPSEGGSVQVNIGGAFYGDHNFLYKPQSQQLWVTGVAGTPAIFADLGFIQSSGGFLSSQATPTADSIQTSGGVTAQAFYPLNLSTSTGLLIPESGYGGFGYKGGSVFWYYNAFTPAWVTVDFATIGAGVTSLSGTPNQIVVSGATGVVQISLAATAQTTLFNSTAAGSSLAFQAGSGTFTVLGNGTVSSHGVVTADGGFTTGSSSPNAIQAPAGTVMGNYLSANQQVILVGQATPPAGPSSGQFSFYASTTGLNFWTGTSWVALTVAGVSSVTGTANQITASPTAGAVVLSLPSEVRTDYFHSTATGSALAFGNASGSFTILANGTLSTNGVITSANSINCTSVAYNAIQTIGGILGTTLYAGVATAPIVNTPVITGVQSVTNQDVFAGYMIVNAAGAVRWSGYKARGTPSSLLPVVTGDVLNNQIGFGWDGSAWTQGAATRWIVDNTVSAGNVPTAWQITTTISGIPYLRFQTTSAGLLTNGNNSWTVDQNGVLYANQIGVKTTTPGTSLDVNGTVRATGFDSPTTGAGTELLFSSGTGIIIAVDRGAGGTHLPLDIQGNPLCLNVGGSAGQRVGVNTNSPAFLFDVNGTANASQGYYVNGTQAIDISRNAFFANLTLTGTISLNAVSCGALVATSVTTSIGPIISNTYIAGTSVAIEVGGPPAPVTVINSALQFVGSGGVNTSGGVTCSSLTVGGAITFASLTVTGTLTANTYVGGGGFSVTAAGAISTGGVINTSNSVNVTVTTSSSSIQTSGGVNAAQGYWVNGTPTIDISRNATFAGLTATGSTSLNAVSCAGLVATTLTTSTGPIISNTYVAGTSFAIESGGPPFPVTVINSSMQFIGSGGVNTSGGVTCSSLSASGGVTANSFTGGGGFAVTSGGAISTGGVINTSNSINVTITTAFNSIQTTGGVNAAGGYYIGATQIIDTSGVFRGGGIVMSHGIDIAANGLVCGALSINMGSPGIQSAIALTNTASNNGTTNNIVYRSYGNIPGLGSGNGAGVGLFNGYTGFLYANSPNNGFLGNLNAPGAWDTRLMRFLNGILIDIA